MTRVSMDVLYPYRDDESPEEWTSRVLSHASEHGTYRQCSIGWHGECSQRDMGPDSECNCLCHAEGVDTWTVEGHSEGGTVQITRIVAGKEFWPAKDGEPETAWAWWVLAVSEDEAREQAIAKETRILEERLDSVL